MTKLKLTKVTDQDYAIGDTPQEIVSLFSNYISQNNTPDETNSDDIELMKKSLLNNQCQYMAPYYKHHFFGTLESENEEEPFNPYKCEFDADGHSIEQSQQWGLSFAPSTLEIIVADNSDPDEVIRLLQKTIDAIKRDAKNNPDLFVSDSKERGKLLESIAESDRMRQVVINHFSNRNCNRNYH